MLQPWHTLYKLIKPFYTTFKTLTIPFWNPVQAYTNLVRRPLKEPVPEVRLTLVKVDFPQITESLGCVEVRVSGSGIRV